jgi:hypothetical protein
MLFISQTNKLLRFLICLFLFSFSSVIAASENRYTYAVVISKAAYADAGWKAVADTLLTIHGKTESRLFTWSSSVNECKADLAAFMPTYIGFIARPATECNTSFVAAASGLTRNLDSDPYGDAYWGVITGFEAADALRAVTESLTVKTVIQGSNTLAYEPPLQRFYQAIGMDCASYTQTDYIFPNTNGNRYRDENGHPDGQKDRVNLICKWLNADKINVSVSGKGSIEGPVDCLITGGHGNVDVWQCHYSDAGTEGYVRSSAGQLVGETGSGGRTNINAKNPMIYWCASNCLMATPDSKNNFVYAAFHTGHAVQMYGFIPLASSGDDFMAWGVYDRTTKFAGNYTLPQSFFIEQNNSIFETRHSTGQFDLESVKSYIDAMGMYGDPAANVKFHDFGDSAKSYKEKFSYTTNAQGTTTFEYSITAMAHALEFGQGYCYQFRPVFFMPVRIDASSIAIVKNEGKTPDITDNLILWELLSKGQTLAKGATKTLSFTAKPVSGTGAVGEPIRAARTAPIAQIWGVRARGNDGINVILRNIPAGPAVLSVVSASGKRIASMKTTSSGEQSQVCKVPLKAARGANFLVLRHEKVSLKTKIAAVE